MEYKDLRIGGKVIYNSQQETVLDLTSNSVLITRTKKNVGIVYREDKHGNKQRVRPINCTSWLSDVQIQKELTSEQ